MLKKGLFCSLDHADPARTGRENPTPGLATFLILWLTSWAIQTYSTDLLQDSSNDDDILLWMLPSLSSADKGSEDFTLSLMRIIHTMYLETLYQSSFWICSEYWHSVELYVASIVWNNRKTYFKPIVLLDSAWSEGATLLLKYLYIEMLADGFCIFALLFWDNSIWRPNQPA